MAKKRSYSIHAQVPEVVAQKSTGFRLWGADDKLPNNLIRVIADSGTATTCISRRRKFINGNGFVEESSRDLMINPEETASNLLANICPSVAVFEGFFLRVLYRMDGKIGSAYYVNPKMLRPMLDGSWRYNYLMGEKLWKKNEDVIIPSFNPKMSPGERAKTIHKQIAEYGYQLGEIYAVYQKKLIEGGDYVPIPDCYSGYEDFESDAALQRQDKRNIKKGFRPQVIISMPGKVDNKTTDKDGKTDSDYLDETLQDFTKEDGSTIALLEGTSKDEIPTVTPFPVADILNGTDTARVRIARAICRHTSVPPILIGMEEASILGNNQTFFNSLKMFLALVNDCQEMISRAFSNLWPEYDWKIQPFNVIDYIDPLVAEKLTDDEIRALGKYLPLEKTITTEQDKIINNIKSLPSDVAQEIVKRMSNEQLFSLIGLE